MELKILPDGRRIALHPDCRDAVKSLTHWQRHAIFHQVCRQYYAKTHPNAAGDIGPLSTEGLDVVRRSLSAQEAAGIADSITANLEAQGSNAGAHAPVSDDPRDVIINVAQTGDLRARLQDALPRILNDDTTALLERYYESHFRIHGALTYRTHALTRQVGSFLWHRDLAPMGQVHLIVYLTPSGVTSGSTQLLGLYQSAWAASLGYHYENSESRVREIETIFDRVEETPHVHCPELAAGDSLLFPAPRVLHRGDLPTQGYRDTFTLILLPSSVPWQADIEDFGTDHIFGDTTMRTLVTDPFQALSPELPAAAQGDLNITEQWVLVGQMQP